MFKRMLVFLFLGSALLAVLAAEPAAQDVQSESLVSVSFYETDLRQALADLSLDAGVPIVMAPEVSGYVTAEIDGVTLDRALDMVLLGTGFVAVKLYDYWFVCPADPDSFAFAQASQSRLVKLNYLGAEEAQNLLAENYRRYTRIDKTGNAISITAPPVILDRVEEEVRNVDQPIQHVVLDALVVVMEKEDLLNLGVQWGFPTAQAGLFSNDNVRFDDGGLNIDGVNTPWGVQIGYTTGREFTNALQLKLNLLSQNNEAMILASPQVMAQDGKPASIEVITEEYFEILTRGYYVDSQLEKIDSGTSLNILPQVGGNGEITLTMSTEVSDVVARTSTGLPVVTRRKASSTVRVEDGGTAAVAGLIDNRLFEVDEEVPGLGKLPLAGNLFSNDNSLDSSRQVAVFVTARLLKEPEEGEVAGAALRPVYKPVDEDEFRKELEISLKQLAG